MAKPAKKRLTKAQMRVQICKDVIAQVKAKRFTVKSGDYFYAPGDPENTGFRAQFDRTEDQSKPVTLPKTCAVCAIGSVFVSALDKYNALSREEFCFNDADYMLDYLQRWDFTEDQMRLMECSFERTDAIDPAGNKPAAVDRAIRLGNRYRNTGNRLIAIMNNVIANGGTFKP